jgi:hypothetical protein
MTDDTNRPSAADHIGQAAGGITGVVAGAAIGVTAGPVGVLLGGIAGAIGGWWSGRAIAEAAEDITAADEQFYREDYQRVERRVDLAQRAGFDEARRAYLLGDLASANPDYRGRRFEDVEGDLARGWESDPARSGDWPLVREYASVGWSHGAERRKGPERRSGSRQPGG